MVDNSTLCALGAASLPRSAHAAKTKMTGWKKDRRDCDDGEGDQNNRRHGPDNQQPRGGQGREREGGGHRV